MDKESEVPARGSRFRRHLSGNVPQSQAYCIKNGIDFLDLAGNISINIPGKFTLQRLGMRNKERTESAATPSMINVFSGRSSRVLRVLLEKPKFWTQSAIAREMEAETARVLEGFQNQQLTFTVSNWSTFQSDRNP